HIRHHYRRGDGPVQDPEVVGIGQVKAGTDDGHGGVSEGNPGEAGEQGAAAAGGGRRGVDGRLDAGDLRVYGRDLPAIDPERGIRAGVTRAGGHVDRRRGYVACVTDPDELDGLVSQPGLEQVLLHRARQGDRRVVRRAGSVDELVGDRTRRVGGGGARVADE